MTSFVEKPSARTDWETPAWLFAQLNARYNFDIDVCATPENAKCETYFTPEQDGLNKEWWGICWMNPPYGKAIGEWVKKAFIEARDRHATTVCLLPARSNNEWWKWVIQGDVYFIRKKLQFVGAPFVSMFPNVVCVFRSGLEEGGHMYIWEPKK